jgi:hypothetical protein
MFDILGDRGLQQINEFANEEIRLVSALGRAVRLLDLWLGCGPRLGRLWSELGRLGGLGGDLCLVCMACRLSRSGFVNRGGRARARGCGRGRDDALNGERGRGDDDRERPLLGVYDYGILTS